MKKQCQLYWNQKIQTMATEATGHQSIVKIMLGLLAFVTPPGLKHIEIRLTYGLLYEHVNCATCGCTNIVSQIVSAFFKPEQQTIPVNPTVLSDLKLRGQTLTHTLTQRKPHIGGCRSECILVKTYFLNHEGRSNKQNIGQHIHRVRIRTCVTKKFTIKTWNLETTYPKKLKGKRPMKTHWSSGALTCAGTFATGAMEKISFEPGNIFTKTSSSVIPGIKML